MSAIMRNTAIARESLLETIEETPSHTIRPDTTISLPSAPLYRLLMYLYHATMSNICDSVS